MHAIGTAPGDAAISAAAGPDRGAAVVCCRDGRSAACARRRIGGLSQTADRRNSPLGAARPARTEWPFTAQGADQAVWRIANRNVERPDVGSVHAAGAVARV